MSKEDAMREFVSEMLFRNEHGMWFFKIPDRDSYVPIPSWMNARCELLFAKYIAEEVAS